MRAAILAAVLVAGCSESISPPPLGDYTAWDQFVFDGPAPGHGDTHRVVYVNPLARCGLPTCTPGAPVGPVYLTPPEGAAIVKEIYEEEGGALRYVAIMRRLTSETPAALTEEGGWLFSSSDTPGGDEIYRELCWARCHVAAPYNGMFYNYRQPLPAP